MARQRIPRDVERGRCLIDSYTEHKGCAKSSPAAFFEGVYARTLGTVRTDNPYSEREALYSAWNEGWADESPHGDEERRQIRAALEYARSIGGIG